MMMAPLPPHYQTASPRQPVAAEAAAGKAASASQLTSSCPQGDRQLPKGEDQIYRSFLGKIFRKENPILIKKKIKFSSYTRKFRVEQLQSHTVYDYNGLLIYGEIIVYFLIY
jgi:hypothetical protein